MEIASAIYGTADQDGVVRVHVHRLRVKLPAYYRSSIASGDLVCIDLPKHRDAANEHYIATWQVAVSCLISAEAFAAKLSSHYGLKPELAQRWFHKGLDSEIEETLAQALAMVA